MTSNRWKTWRAEEPSASFTDATVAAVLREQRRPRVFGVRRWAVVGAMAAVFAGGAAWGLGGLSFRAPPLPAPLAPATVEAAPPPTSRVVHAPPVPTTSAPPPSIPRHKAEPARRVFQPRCFCSPKEAICDCF